MMSVNSRLKATKIGQRKPFYRQRIPEPCCVRKETVDIDILVHLRMVIEKSCNLSKKKVGQPPEKGSGTS